jgi:hypothetical protein
VRHAKEEVEMSKRTIAGIALMAALAIPGTALAERLEFDDRMDETQLSTGQCNAPIVLDTTFDNDELSANERIMADAWKSHLHARKAAALEGRG